MSDISFTFWFSLEINKLRSKYIRTELIFLFSCLTKLFHFSRASKIEIEKCVLSTNFKNCSATVVWMAWNVPILFCDCYDHFHYLKWKMQHFLLFQCSRFEYSNQNKMRLLFISTYTYDVLPCCFKNDHKSIFRWNID